MSSTARFLTPQGASHRAPFPDRKQKEESTRTHTHALHTPPSDATMDGPRREVMPQPTPWTAGFGRVGGYNLARGPGPGGAPPPHGWAILGPSLCELVLPPAAQRKECGTIIAERSPLCSRG